MSLWINNQPLETSEKLNVTNPADGSIIQQVSIADQSSVDNAVKAANQAYKQWSNRTIKDRAGIIAKFYKLVDQHKNEIAQLIVKEHGKTMSEALAEIAKGNETVEYAYSLPLLYGGRQLEVSRGVYCNEVRKPLGVVVSIVPFNFPFMVPMWTLPIAIVTGNTLVLKPSEKVPLTMRYTMELLKEAGVPDGVVNLVNGTAPVVNQLCDHELVKAVTFVGTSRVAELLTHRCRLKNKRVLALGGAKNHLIASPDCKVDMTAQDIVNSFTGCSGQRCMAASVLLTIKEQPELLDEIVKRAQLLKPGQDGSNVMGPVIDQESCSKIHGYISDSEKSGAKILLDGRNWQQERGYWVGPTIILHNNKQDKALHDEIFGPVLSILQVSSPQEAIEIENGNPYGNAACIYTTMGGVAEWFTKRFSAGMLGVNIGVPVPREPFSFGGINKSKYGDFDITGDGGLEFFTSRIKITQKWAPPSEQNWMS